jgi:sugar (pentulose or hexulose) kinase
MVNAKPVYTIHEILEERAITPKKLFVIGGPAAVFKDLLSSRLGLEVIVPPLHGVANAIGAALTRTTSHLAMTANTARGRLSVPTARHLPLDPPRLQRSRRRRRSQKPAQGRS